MESQTEVSAYEISSLDNTNIAGHKNEGAVQGLLMSNGSNCEQESQTSTFNIMGAYF